MHITAPAVSITILSPTQTAPGSQPQVAADTVAGRRARPDALGLLAGALLRSLDDFRPLGQSDPHLYEVVDLIEAAR